MIFIQNDMYENWEFNPVKDFDKKLTDRLKDFPREPDIFVYFLRLVVLLIIRFWLCIYHRYKIAGKENLPKGKSCIIVSNHSSHLDALLLMSAFPLKQAHHVFPIAAKDYFFSNIPKIFFSSIVVNAMPFERIKYAPHSILLCREMLQKPGNVFILFPEGTRTQTGQVNEFKPGVGLLAAGLDAPVIPCYLSGAFDAWPKGKIFPRPKKVIIKVGKEISFKNYENNKESALAIAKQLQDAVISLK